MGKPAKYLLNKCWGYDSFRPMQEEIIISILEGKDTTALLPTGGEISFQIPSMMTDGITLVVTPLTICLLKTGRKSKIERHTGSGHYVRE